MDWQVFQQWLERLHNVPWLNRTFIRISLLDWLISLTVLVVLFLLLRLVLGVVKLRVNSWAERSANQWDDAVAQMLQATKNGVLFLVSFYLASLTIPLEADVANFIRIVTVIALLVQGALWGTVLLEYNLQRSMRRQMERDPAMATTISALRFLGGVVLWTIVLLLALDNAGIDVTALVAGLGVGGIAVALAAQSILGDLFASMSIVLDKPFVLGDFIVVDDLLGTVEHIGLKTTRLRSLSGEQLVFSNTDLLQSRIRNFKRMYERRVVFSVGVIYNTPAEKLEQIPEMIRTIVETQEDVRFDRSHFKEFGASSLNYEAVYYVLVPDYNRYMDIQQQINLALFRRFEQEGIDFAYPTQTIHLEPPISSAPAVG